MSRDLGARAAATLRTHWMAVALAVVAGLIYLIPQFRAWLDGYSYVFLLKQDEPLYVALARRVAQGDAAGAHPFTYEHRDETFILPLLPQYLTHLLARLCFVGFDGSISLARFVFAGAQVLILYTFCFRVSGSRWLSLLAAALGLVDPGAYVYKPIVSSIGAEALQLNRYASPLVGLTVFLLFALSTLRVFVEDRLSFMWLVVCSLATGAMFYLSPFYWTHALLALVLLFVFVKHPRKRTIFGVGIAITFVLGLGYLFQTLEFRELSVYDAKMWRGGHVRYERVWEYLTHRGMILFLLLSLPVFLSKRREHRLLSVLVVSGYLLYINTLFTGVDVESFHWNYTLYPLLTFSGILGVREAAARVRPEVASSPRWRGVVAALVVAAVVLASRASWREYDVANTYQLGTTDRPYHGAFTWLAENSESLDVVLAESHVMFYVPARTGNRVFLGFPHSFLSNPELHDRVSALWALDGSTGEELAAAHRAEDRMFPMFWSGLPADLDEEMRASGYPPIDDALHRRLMNELIRRHEARSLADVAATLARYRIDYVLLGPREAHWNPTPLLGELDQVYADSQVRILRTRR